MRLRTPVLAAAFLFPLLSLSPAVAQDSVDVVVTEADFKAWMVFEFERHLRDARVEQDEDNRAKHEASYRAAVKATGMSAARADVIERALLMVDDAVLQVEQGQMTKQDSDAFLSGFKPQTVATARKHEQELRGDRGFERAQEQARKEAGAARKGDLVTQAELQGVWVVDADASIRSLLGAMADAPEMAGARAELEKSLDGTSYEFKGDTVIVTLTQNGKKHVTKGTYRIEDRQLIFDQAQGVRDIEVGMMNGRLVLGVGFASATYKRKP